MTECNSQLLSKYLDGETSKEEGHEVELHLQSCGECRQELAELTEMSRLVGGMTFANITDKERERIYEAVESVDEAPIWRIGGMLGLIAASILVICGVWLAT